MNRHKFSGNNRVFLKAARSLFTLFLASLMAVSAVAPSIPARAASGNMQITPIDFGDTGNWGDSTMVSSGGKNLLMDTYIKDKYDTLVNYLDDHHFYTFDIYLSHYHYDHMDQIPSILYDNRFNVSKVYLPDPSYLKKGAQSSSYCKSFLDGYDNIVEAANDTGTQIIYLKKGSSFTVGNAKVDILWGCSYNSGTYDASYINNNSLVAKVTSGTVSYLNCGDIEKETENQIVSSGINIRAVRFVSFFISFTSLRFEKQYADTGFYTNSILYPGRDCHDTSVLYVSFSAAGRVHRTICIRQSAWLLSILHGRNRRFDGPSRSRRYSIPARRVLWRRSEGPHRRVRGAPWR